MKLAILVSVTLAAGCGGKSGGGSDQPYDLRAECEAYTQELELLEACSQLSQDEVRALKSEHITALNDYAAALEDETVAPATAERCHAGRAKLRDRAATSGC